LLDPRLNRKRTFRKWSRVYPDPGELAVVKRTGYTSPTQPNLRVARWLVKGDHAIVEHPKYGKFRALRAGRTQLFVVPATEQVYRVTDDAIKDIADVTKQFGDRRGFWYILKGIYCDPSTYLLSTGDETKAV
jgi:hypothetical protein